MNQNQPEYSTAIKAKTHGKVECGRKDDPQQIYNRYDPRQIKYISVNYSNRN